MHCAYNNSNVSVQYASNRIHLTSDSLLKRSPRYFSAATTFSAAESALGLFNLRVIFGIPETGADPVEPTTLCSLVPFRLLLQFVPFLGSLAIPSSLLATDSTTDGFDKGDPNAEVDMSGAGEACGSSRAKTSLAASRSSAVCCGEVLISRVVKGNRVY